MNLQDNLTGIQHVGIPTNDIEEKIIFIKNWAINHITIDVKDVEKVSQWIKETGMNMTQDILHFLPF